MCPFSGFCNGTSPDGGDNRAWPWSGRTMVLCFAIAMLGCLGMMLLGMLAFSHLGWIGPNGFCHF